MFCLYFFNSQWFLFVQTAIIQIMKTILRILIILDFAAIVFIPNIYMSRPIMIPMFALMIGMVVLYWFAMFWVSKKDAVKVLKKDPVFDVFAGKIPTDPSADLTRGRLCIVDDTLRLLQRNDDKERKNAPCKEVWSLKTKEITSLGFGKVLPARKGLIIYMGDDEVKFTCSKIAKQKDELYKALGWDLDLLKKQEQEKAQQNRAQTKEVKSNEQDEKQRTEQDGNQQ